MTPTNEPDDACANCQRMRSAHRLANCSDGPHVGEAFLVCPTNTYKPWPRSENERARGQRQCQSSTQAACSSKWVRCERAAGHAGVHTFSSPGMRAEWPKRRRESLT